MSKTDFKLGKSSVTLDHVNGEVLSFNKHSETHVRGGGGGHGNARVIVRSSQLTLIEFFVKSDDGEEFEVRVTGQPHLALRQGQHITLVRTNVNNDEAYWAYLYVEETRMEYYLRSRIRSYKNKTLWHLPLFLGSIFCVKSYYEIDGWIWPILIGIFLSLFAIAMVEKVLFRPRAIKLLDAKIASYVETIL